MQKTPARRLLMVEFVVDERWVFASRAFPFIQGACKELGIDVRWLWFGSQMVTQKGDGTTFRQHVQMCQQDLETLKHHTEELRPTHILLSHDISDAARLELLAGDPVPKLLSMADSQDQSSTETMAGAIFRASGQQQIGLVEKTDWLLQWLGDDLKTHPKAGAFMVDVVEPDYSAVAANSEARLQHPLLLVLGGITCDYRASLAENVRYNGIDLSGCVHDFGCAFCTWYRGPASDLGRDPVELAIRQVRRILGAGGANGRFQGRIQFLDVRLMSRLQALTEALLALKMPPTRFSFEPRADRVVQVGPKLEQAVAALAAAGHSVELLRMGAENLVEEDNQRLTKGISLDQQDQAMELLRRLHEQFPDHFYYDPTWGYITCTPWTTLDMYALGVKRAMDRGFDPQGVWLYTPLLLFHRSPILELARKEPGIICDQWDDLAPLYQPAANNVPPTAFQPWRFLDPRAAVAFALTVRFCAAALRPRYPDTLFRGDELYESLLSSAQLGGEFARPDLFALEVVKAIIGLGAGASRRAILDQAVACYATLVGPAAAPGTHTAGSCAHGARVGACRQDKLDFLVEAVRTRFSRFRPITLAQAWEEPEAGANTAATVLHLTLCAGTTKYDLRLVDLAKEEKSYFRTRHFSVSHRSALPAGNDKYQPLIIDFVKTLESALEHHARELLPS